MRIKVSVDSKSASSIRGIETDAVVSPGARVTGGREVPKSEPTVAVPPRTQPTLTVLALGAVRFTENSALPPFSAMVREDGLICTVGTGSSSRIVRVWVSGATRVTPAVAVRVHVAVSSSSSRTSSRVSTVIVVESVPAGIVTTVGVARRSTPNAAVPAVVRVTSVSLARVLARVISIVVESPSSTELAAVLKERVGTGSFSMIVIVCTAVAPSCAPTGASRVSTIVSSPSARRSSRIGTVIVWSVEPAGKTTGLIGAV